MSEELKAAQARIACLEGEIAKRDARIVELESGQSADMFLTLTGEITQLRAELAAIKAQEPVAFVHFLNGEVNYESSYVICNEPGDCLDDRHEWRPIYAAPVSEAKAQGVVMPEKIQQALDFSRNFADSKPDIGITERQHILGLANLLEKVARLNAAPAAPAADAWIPVSERLPEPNTKVLVHGPKCKHFFALRKNRQRNFWEFLDGNTCNEKITHWAPLPAEPAAHRAQGVV